MKNLEKTFNLYIGYTLLLHTFLFITILNQEKNAGRYLTAELNLTFSQTLKDIRSLPAIFKATLSLKIQL